ncbi:MAG TPA: hypothetical protein PK863_04280 [Candidatus Dojkabacteria bacterium]|nr:hypothetical protein [Candidatus Dojkabacteria bacterium]
MNNYKVLHNLSLFSLLAFVACIAIILTGFVFRSNAIFSTGLVLLVTTVPTLIILRVSLFN